MTCALCGRTGFVNGTSVVVPALENTQYAFLVKASDGQVLDTNAFTPYPNTTTLIKGTRLALSASLCPESTDSDPPWRHFLLLFFCTAPTFNVAASVSTVDSVKFSWKAGSSLTAYYLVYGERVISNRDLTVSNSTLLQNSTSTNYTATGLSSGTSYLFTVLAVSKTGTSTNAASFTFQTASTSSNSDLPAGCTFQKQNTPPPGAAQR